MELAKSCLPACQALKFVATHCRHYCYFAACIARRVARLRSKAARHAPFYPRPRRAPRPCSAHARSATSFTVATSHCSYFSRFLETRAVVSREGSYWFPTSGYHQQPPFGRNVKIAPTGVRPATFLQAFQVVLLLCYNASKVGGRRERARWGASGSRVSTNLR